MQPSRSSGGDCGHRGRHGGGGPPGTNPGGPEVNSAEVPGVVELPPQPWTPDNFGTEFFNYKKTHSIVLLTAIDANCVFRVVLTPVSLRSTIINLP